MVKFCYLGDMIKIGSPSKKFRELSGVLVGKQDSFLSSQASFPPRSCRVKTFFV